MEDKLGHDERVRLECIAQSIANSPGDTTDTILARAERFERFILKGKIDNGS